MLGRLIRREHKEAQPDYPGYEPRNPWRDFWDYVREDRPHRWTSLGVALAISYVIVWAVNNSFVRPVERKAQIVYFESWEENRSIEDVRRDWVERLKQANRDNAERRRRYQDMARSLNIGYDAEAAAKADRETQDVLNADFSDFIRTGKLPDAVIRHKIAPPALPDGKPRNGAQSASQSGSHSGTPPPAVPAAPAQQPSPGPAAR